MSLSGLNTLSPVNFTYLHDKSLVINQNTFATQQGLNLNLVNALSSCKDNVIQNYSNIFLSDTIKANDFGYIKIKQPINLTFPTYLALSAYPSTTSNTLYTTISSNPALSSRITFSKSLSDDASTYFSFINIDGIKCRITTTDNFSAKSLTVDIASLSCYFATRTETISASGADLFEYSLDNKGFLKLFFRNNNSFFIVRKVGDTLSAVDVLNTGPLSGDVFATTYTGKREVNFLNDFVYYQKDRVSDFALNEVATVKDVEQNHVLFYNYESDINFASGADVYVDFYKTKNVLSDNYFVNDKIPFADSVVQRKYTTILSKQNSEKYNGDFQLNYNYYTKEYSFLPDVATKFTLPATLYPYSSLNIDDSSLINNGSYGGQSPVFSDKVNKSLNYNINSVNFNEANGSYLCTWLYTDTAQLTSYWVDRYYNPKLISTSVAFSGASYQVFPYYNSLSSYFNKFYSNRDFSYYDVRSSLTFEPSATYYYSRIGNKYINKVLDTIPVYVDTFERYRFNSYSNNTNNIQFSASYGSFILQPKDNNNSFTLSFDLLASNLSAVNCNVLVGNNFDEGITIYKGGLHNIYTPGFFMYTLDTLKFYDKNFNTIFTANLSAAIGAPYKILDVINYGFDHTIKILYQNLSNTYPGILDLNIHNKITSKVEFSSLAGIFGAGILSKTYQNSNFVYYRSVGVNNYLVKFDYINNTLISNDVTSGLTIQGSAVSYNNNLVYLSGYRGVIVGNYGVSKITDAVYFKNLSTNEEFLTLSTNRDRIYDIIEYNNSLLVQTKNVVTAYDSNKRTIGTFAVNTSAVSGFKIDIINDNYQPKLLSFFKNDKGNIGIAKYDFASKEIESVSATSLSAYDQFYQEVVPSNLLQGPMFTPVNFSDINKINKFDKNDVVVRADIFSGNDYQNKAVSVEAIDLQPYTNQNITLVFNSPTGNIQFYNNGILKKNVSLSGVNITNFLTSHYMNNNFGVGIPYIDNTAASNIAPFDYASKLSINNLKVYSKSLNEDEVKFNYLANQIIDTVNFDIPQGTRNNTDTASSYNRYNIPGRKNNNVKIYIKNLDLSDYHQEIIKQKINEKLSSITPINTNDVQLFFINNE